MVTMEEYRQIMLEVDEKIIQVYSALKKEISEIKGTKTEEQEEVTNESNIEYEKRPDLVEKRVPLKAKTGNFGRMVEVSDRIVAVKRHEKEPVEEEEVEKDEDELFAEDLEES